MTFALGTKAKRLKKSEFMKRSRRRFEDRTSLADPCWWSAPRVAAASAEEAITVSATVLFFAMSRMHARVNVWRARLVCILNNTNALRSNAPGGNEIYP